MSLIISQSTTYELILLSLFLVALVIQLFYYYLIYFRVALYSKKESADTTLETNLPPVSVVICARNEQQNLELFLPLVLEQNYRDFEVIVVDDCSVDDTDMLLKRFTQKYSNLRYTAIKPDDKFSHGKKLALTIGIKAAKNDWVLLTDADCKPASENWIATMASNFNESNQIVLGYGGYLPGRGLLNKIIRFDTLFIALQYLSFALMGKPYMGVGRNLAYRKDLFFKTKGFASHSHLDSGDDDLFVNQVAKKNTTAVEFRHASHTRSVAESTFSGWLKQKKRHLSSSPLYKSSTKIWLALEPVSRLLFWICAAILIAQQIYPIFVAGLVVFHLITTLVILKIAMNRLNERKIFILSLMYDLLSPLLFGMLMLTNRLTKKRSKWN